MEFTVKDLYEALGKLMEDNPDTSKSFVLLDDQDCGHSIMTGLEFVLHNAQWDEMASLDDDSFEGDPSDDGYEPAVFLS